MDAGRRWTDKQLFELEKHLEEIYSQALTELTEKTNEYFKQFERLDAEKRKLLEAGKITKREYREWRKNKIAMGKHWTAMKENAAKDLAAVNQHAQEYLNGKLPEIYAYNYNFNAHEIEGMCGNAITFELADQRTVRNLIFQGDRPLVPLKKLDPAKDIPWNMQKINSEVLQGIYQGESIPKIAARLEKVGVDNKVSAVRAARTAVTNAENKARQDSAEHAAKAGVEMGKCWLATHDGRTREWHLQADYMYGTSDKAIPIDEPFEVDGEDMMYPGDLDGSPANVYNCRCSYKNVVFGFKSTLPPELRGKIHVEFT